MDMAGKRVVVLASNYGLWAEELQGPWDALNNAGHNVTLATYRVLAIIGFTLFGVGLAFYATPSTDAALSALPDDQAGSGAGIYKMASSLGASFGVAISATVFSALSGSNGAVAWIEGVISYLGRQDNLAVREAALFALAINLLMVVAAIVSIVATIPARKGSDATS